MLILSANLILLQSLKPKNCMFMTLQISAFAYEKKEFDDMEKYLMLHDKVYYSCNKHCKCLRNIDRGILGQLDDS